MNKLYGFCVFVMYTGSVFQLNHSAPSGYTVVPVNTTGCLGDLTKFTCDISSCNTQLIWFVNSLPVNALPREYNATSVSVGKQSSILSIRALEETNNSVIECAIIMSSRIANFTNPVFLRVIRRPSPPTGLCISTVERSLVANITWNPVFTLNEFKRVATFYIVSIANISAYKYTTISTINTSNNYLHYNFSTFHTCRLESIRFSVHSVVPEVHDCPKSEQSNWKAFTDIVSAVNACFNGKGLYDAVYSCTAQVYRGIKLVISLLMTSLFSSVM